MEREKITFALFLVPIFLFSASLKHWKLDRGKDQSSVLFPQQIISLEEGLSFQSKGSPSGLDQALPKTKPDFPGQEKEAVGEASQSRKIESVTPGRKRYSRPGRTRKPDSSVIRHQINQINKGRHFRYEGPQYAPDEILVKFKPTLSEQTIKATIAAYQGKEIKRIPRINVHRIKIKKSTTVEETLYALRKNPDVEYAEPNYVAHIAVTPNDELFRLQYALSNPGGALPIPGSPQRTENADIKATATWEETKGDEDIIIAVIDTGVELLHPDIKNKIHPGGKNFGYDPTDPNYDESDPNPDAGATDADEAAHGTHVAGIAAAETDNEVGIAGVAWNCKILPLKVIDYLGELYFSYVINAIIYAAGLDENNDNKADVDVINLSVGGNLPSDSLEDALKYAYDKNIVIVAAAGNYYAPWGQDVLYPAAYDDYCLAVAATDYNDSWWDQSNFGPEVDVAAPGVDIWSLVPTWFPALKGWSDLDPYGFTSGTSVAAPHVAGLAALIKSVKPHLTAAQIMNVIRYSADDVNSVNNRGRDDNIGYGRINMEKALVPIVIKPSK